MRKLLKSKKALSPVVAAIILIAVTVAVSIAVAAWMGSLTFTFMETEEMTIIRASFTDSNTISMTCINTGTADVTITAATVTGENVTASTISGSGLVDSDGNEHTITVDTTGDAVDGNSYLVELISSKGNKFSYTVIA